VRTEIIPVDTDRIDTNQIIPVVKVLKDGGVIAYPTDTFYGLGANCFSEQAVSRVYLLKARDFSKPLSIIIPDRDKLEELVLEPPRIFDVLADKFWPGPLTIVLRASKKIPDIILGASQTIGVRLPDHPWLRALVKHTGFPITATSANLSDKDEVSNPQVVIRDFSGKVDLIVDGGKTPGFKPSTVVDISSGRPEILREGAIPASELRGFLT
jgi:L-threonylcarbamoyladenylate synthase